MIILFTDPSEVRLRLQREPENQNASAVEPPELKTKKGSNSFHFYNTYIANNTFFIVIHRHQNQKHLCQNNYFL